MILRVSAIAIGVVAILSVRTSAQERAMVPLGEVARQAEAARATVKKAKKTYTNASLSADPRGEPAPPRAPASGFVSKTLDQPVSAEEMVERSEAEVESETIAEESEEKWRTQAAAFRKRIDDTQTLLAEMSVPNALTEENPIIKKSVENRIANTRAALDGLRKSWAAFEASAREKKIPMWWIEPSPAFAQ